MNIEVRPKEGIWKISKLLSERTAHGIYPHVYLPQSLYSDFISPNPTPKALSIVEHEKKHVVRQAELGWLLWLVLYFISAQFRLNEELIAIQAEMKSLKLMGQDLDIDQRAQMLSSWLYWKCVSLEKATVLLEEMWQKSSAN